MNNLMELRITQLNKIEIMPENEFVEIAQNVRQIVSTIKGEVALDRDFGVNGDLLDAPLSVVESRMTARIISAVNHFERRVKVTDVIYNNPITGELDVTLKMILIEKFLRGDLVVQ